VYFVWTLALAGLLLIFLEFFLPSAIMAIGGGLLLLTSFFFFHMADPRPFSLLVYTASLLGTALVMIRVALWKVKGNKKEAAPEVSIEGFQALIYPKELVGKTGIAATDLKPSGQVRIEDKSFQALSRSAIDQGTEIQVLQAKGPHLIVKAVNKEGS
jgi:membrane-bound ClpP family serine protease